MFVQKRKLSLSCTWLKLDDTSEQLDDIVNLTYIPDVANT